MSRAKKPPANKNQFSFSFLVEEPAPAAPPPRVLDDAEARSIAATALDRSLLVEAGAGTGKTSLIVERIAALVESGVRIGQIVAITFTEKAAGELKLRVRSELEKRSANAHARQALAELEQASISTIHAWCARLLRENPVEAGVDPLFTVLDEPGRETLFERAWESWLGRSLSGAEPVPIEEIPGLTPDWWLRNLRALAIVLVRNRNRLPGALPVVRGTDPLPALELALARVPDLGRAATEWCRNPDDKLLPLLREIESSIAGYFASPPERRAAIVLAQSPFESSYTTKGAAKNWKAPVADPLLVVRQLATDLAAAWGEARAALENDVAARVARWLNDSFLPAYDAEKRRQGALEFDDLLVLTRNLLRTHPSVRARVRKGIRQLILDEFQDTDPVQCEAAFLLTAQPEPEGRGAGGPHGGEAPGNHSPKADWREAKPSPGALFLVGDPKQSIYAFRGADIETYLTVRERLDVDKAVTAISTNFRSRRGVLDWVNAVFEKLIERTGRIQPVYRALDVFHEDGAAGPVAGAGVHVLRGPADAAWEHVEESRDAESRSVAALLRDRVHEQWSVRDKKTQAERPAKWGDVVVLLRNRVSSLPAFEGAFRAAGIPYVVVGGRALWERLEVRALAALCAAVENPFDTVSVVAALKSPFFGASDADLLLWKHEHGGFFSRKESGAESIVGRALALVREWNRLRLEMPPERLLRRILTETGAVASFGLKPDGTQRVANLLRLVDASRSAGDAFGVEGATPSFRAWVHWLQEQVRSEREDAEGAILEEEGDAVRIMTMHAAKGLEFPIVVLGDLAARAMPAESFHVDPASDRLCFRLGSKEIGLTTDGFDGARKAQEERSKMEELRLLYVAATRARDSLVLPIFPSKRGKAGFLATLLTAFPKLAERNVSLDKGEGGPLRAIDEELVPVAGSAPVFRVKIDSLEHALASTADPVGDVDPEGAVLAARLAARSRARAVAPVTRLVHLDDAVRSPANKNAPVAKPAWSGPEAADLGTSVHRALEVMDLDDADGVARAAATEARAKGLSSVLVERASALARAALALPCLDRARRSPRLLREWPFALRGEGANPWILEGVLDAAWIEDGALVILDYKTDAVSTPEEVAHAAEHHRPQLLAYAWALSRVTGLPVKEIVLAFLSAGREVSFPVGPADLAAAQRSIEDGFAREFPKPSATAG